MNKVKITYTEKDTYKKVTKTFNSKQLCEFYQQKPYEQIIKVTKVK